MEYIPSSSDAEAVPALLYPVLQPGVSLHQTATDSMLRIEKGTNVLRTSGDAEITGTELAGGEHYQADGYLVEFLSWLDGTSSSHDLNKRFVETYGRYFATSIAEACWTWAARHPDVVEMRHAPLDAPRDLRVSGSPRGFYPAHVTFEIIETCNFTCAHCYYQSSPWKTGRVSYEEAVRIMDLFADNGVRVIELTGGECTIHPDFVDILQYAARRFDMVAVITNGYRIGTNQDLADAVTAIPNVAVQVSIDAMGETHNAFRKHPRSFQAAVEAVRRMVDAGLVVRIASSITEETLDHVVPLYELGRSLGVAKHAFAPIAPLGRGCNVSDPGAGSRRVAHGINERLAPFASDPALKAEADALPRLSTRAEAPRNCGAGWRTFAVDYDGNVRACNYSRKSKKFGNLLEHGYDAVFTNSASFLFKNAPSPGGSVCHGCDYYEHCQGCFVKAFMVSETVYPECPWRRKFFPDMSLAYDPNEAGPVESTTDMLMELPVYTPEDDPRSRPPCSCG